MTPHRRVVMLIPSRDRPRQAIEAAVSAIDHASMSNTFVQVIADGHEFGTRTALEYSDAWDGVRKAMGPFLATKISVTYQGQHLGLVGTLNRQATFAAAGSELMREHEGSCRRSWDCGRVTHIGCMSDDHRIRTRGWDCALAAAAGPWGIAYGNNGLLCETRPTAVVMSADIVRVLEKVGPPILHSYHIDSYWEALGEKLHNIVHMPEIQIERLLPRAAPIESSESSERRESDNRAWERYLVYALGDDAERVMWYRDAAKREHEQMVALAKLPMPISELNRALLGLPNDDRGES